jgi:hypothetical protein
MSVLFMKAWSSGKKKKKEHRIKLNSRSCVTLGQSLGLSGPRNDHFPLLSHRHRLLRGANEVTRRSVGTL